jgi:AcrR family transcriptional regulator
MTRRLSSEDRKAVVLRAARTLFAKQGFAETTLDDIAGRAGVSRPRIIQLFGSKKAIYEAIAASAYRAHPLDQDLEAPIRRRDDRAVFEAFARHILKHTRRREEREIAKILMFARLKEDTFHRVHFHEQDALMIGRLEKYVRQRVTDGAFADIHPLTVIYAYQAMISNLVIYKNVMRRMNHVTVEELSRDCARIFLEGIRAVNPQPKE